MEKTKLKILRCCGRKREWCKGGEDTWCDVTWSRRFTAKRGVRRGVRGRRGREGVVHMRRKSRRLKVTLNPPSVLRCAHHNTTVPFTSERLCGRCDTSICPNADIIFIVCTVEFLEHPVVGHVSYLSPIISVGTTDKRNRYASGKGYCEYNKPKIIFSLLHRSLIQNNRHAKNT